MNAGLLGVGGETETDQCTLEAVIMPTIGVCEDAVLVLQATVAPGWRVVYGGEGTSERPGGWESRASEPGLGFRGRTWGGTLTGPCCVEHGGTKG